jgi:transcriptional regulator NrdR family protein
MAYVLKKGSGKKQVFSPAKLKKSIDGALKDADVKIEKRRQIIDEIVKPISEIVKKKKSISASDLRKSVLGRLETRSKKAVQKWKAFEKKKK